MKKRNCKCDPTPRSIAEWIRWIRGMRKVRKMIKKGKNERSKDD